MMADLDDTFFQEAEQGVTTLIAGMCGISAAPFSMEHLESCLEQPPPSFLTTFPPPPQKEFPTPLSGYDGPPAWNKYGRLRRTWNAPCRSYGNGGPGTGSGRTGTHESNSTGMHGGGCSWNLLWLQYPAGCYAGSSELAVLSSVAARFGGITSAHIRSEGNQLVESVTEMVQATAQSSCTLVISHHKAINRPNWGKTAATISLMQEVNQQGHSVYCDVYPYTASSTGLKSPDSPSPCMSWEKKSFCRCCRIHPAAGRCAMRSWQE